MANVNWKDMCSVINYAKSLGKGLTVFWKPEYKTFAITHTERKDRWENYKVVFQT